MSKQDADFNSLSWLEGSWHRINLNKQNRNGFEIWKKESDNWIGKGITIQGTDTVFIEKLKTILVNDDIYYVADVTENAYPIRFKITSIFQKGFVCENPNHNYPKKISYLLKDDTLKAVTSGNGKEQVFLFMKE